jgi:hypothetical protein
MLLLLSGYTTVESEVEKARSYHEPDSQNITAVRREPFLSEEAVFEENTNAT